MVRCACASLQLILENQKWRQYSFAWQCKLLRKYLHIPAKRCSAKNSSFFDWHQRHPCIPGSLLISEGRVRHWWLVRLCLSVTSRKFLEAAETKKVLYANVWALPLASSRACVRNLILVTFWVAGPIWSAANLASSMSQAGKSENSACWLLTWSQLCFATIVQKLLLCQIDSYVEDQQKWKVCEDSSDSHLHCFCRQTRAAELIKTYSCCLYPGLSLLQHGISGAWTDDERYYQRCVLGGKTVLKLKHVWWLELNATFKASSSRFERFWWAKCKDLLAIFWP